MVKKFAILLFCGFLTLSIQAQNFGGGVILGLSTSQVGGDNLAGFHKAGLLVGAFANTSISQLLSFQMEMTFIQKGSNNPNMNDYEHKNYSQEDISSAYIEIPLLLQYYQSNKLKIEGGLLSAYLIDGYYNDLNGKIPIYTVNPFIKYDFGLFLGIDYTFSNKLSLNTRISNSFLPIGAEDYNHPTYNSKRKGKYNSVLNFAIHYNF
tara:strand:+ start:184 stop:804 length:621 start_codon:yes stop_codon:yes gene_type:complete